MKKDFTIYLLIAMGLIFSFLGMFGCPGGDSIYPFIGFLIAAGLMFREKQAEYALLKQVKEEKKKKEIMEQ